MARILIVDDEANIRRMLAGLLESEGHVTAAAGDADEAIAAMRAEEADVVLLDLALPGANGLVVLERLRVDWPATPVVMMSGRASLSDAVSATRIGAFHFLEKPLSPEALLMAVEGAAELRRARELSRTLTAERSAGVALIGDSAAMQRIRELIAQVAPTDARVLITGESGTGKEVVATMLHAASQRSAAPFVRVNCAAIPRDLVESELFGHERGAFTGASARRRGRFELAHGGTLLLDEIADLGHEAQAKLLRALESGTIERVGGERPIAVNVRVLAATNRDLHAAIDAGGFREDLFYRLNVLRIDLPPLRERAADIPSLVSHFLEQLRIREGMEPPRIGGAAIERLMRYRWPGNVRELANVCERLAILNAGRTVGPAELFGLLADEPMTGEPPEDGLSLADRLDNYERRVIEKSLRDGGGSVAEAARLLETDRANLYRRMKRLGIDR
jgi:two-component system nitrogen regulation response regulator NtrX